MECAAFSSWRTSLITRTWAHRGKGEGRSSYHQRTGKAGSCDPAFLLL